MKHVIGVADMAISSSAEDVLITHSLGSCLGVAVYDPTAGVGGLLHVMLPTSSINPERARGNPCVFVDTGLPHLFQSCYRAGAEKKRLVVKVAGGASVSSGEQRSDLFNIGQRNITILRKLLWKNGVMLDAADVGGSVPRTMTLTMATGEVTIRSQGALAAL